MTQAVINQVVVTLRDGMQFDAVNDGGSVATMDAPPSLGNGDGLTPMEMLLAGLAGCTGMDTLSILRKKRQSVTAYRLEVSGVKAQDHPMVYTEITIRHILTGDDLSEDAVARSIQLSEEKYCSAFAMLEKSATISSSFEITPAAPSD